MDKQVIWFSGGASVLVTMMFVGGVMRESNLATVAVVLLAASFVLGTHCLLSSDPPIKGFWRAAIGAAYWLNLLALGIPVVLSSVLGR
ncbi:MAG: hypothetical protein K2P58_10640 [Hyphomonadaceae bacterium]|nr:hypothetical protein [Hyphomonadaceae bacterium]